MTEPLTSSILHGQLASTISDSFPPAAVDVSGTDLGHQHSPDTIQLDTEWLVVHNPILSVPLGLMVKDMARPFGWDKINSRSLSIYPFEI